MRAAAVKALVDILKPSRLLAARAES